MKNKTKGFLLSVSPKTFENTNGTQYRKCTVSINKTVYFAKIWEKSFDRGVTIGDEYTCELQADGDTVWITVLNGTEAKIATPADFAELFAGLTV